MEAPSDLWVEWCLKPDRRRGGMYPASFLAIAAKARDAGYSSVYWFAAEDAQTILKARSSAGMGRFAVWTNRLVIDLDNGEEQLGHAEAALQARGLAYEVYDSGSKGYHVVIPHDRWYSSRHLPYSQRVWVESLAVGADLSLYQHGRILSLPGRVHPKTGRKKEKVRQVEGAPLALTIVENPEPVFDLAGESEFDLLTIALWRLLQLTIAEPEPGNRHTAMWGVAKAFADAGLSYELALELMQKTNDAWTHPKSLAEVEAAVRPPYRKSRAPHTT